MSSPQKRTRLKHWQGLLAATAILLSACNQQPQITTLPTFCPIAVHPSDDARAWLLKTPMPRPVDEYLNLIGSQQAFFDRGCK